MANEPSNAKREKFAELPRELFQLNQPELDFGIYRHRARPQGRH